MNKFLVLLLVGIIASFCAGIMTEFQVKLFMLIYGFTFIIWFFWFCFIRKQDFGDY
jgi:hypothetical protein